MQVCRQCCDTGYTGPMSHTNHFNAEDAYKSLTDKYDLTFVHELIKSGFKVYLFGGSLRDMVMGRNWKDADLRAWIPLPPAERDTQAERVLVQAGVVINSKIPFGDGFTVFRFVPPQSNSTVGVDLSVVSEQWTVGPDFTINGLYFDLDTKELIDHHHAIEDIEKKVIRTAQPPLVQFTHEPYMIHRTVKSACQFGFAIDSETLSAMKELSHLTQGSLATIADQTMPGMTEWFLGNMFTGLKYNPFTYESLWNTTGLTKVLLDFCVERLVLSPCDQHEVRVFESSSSYGYEQALSMWLSAVARTLSPEKSAEIFSQICTLLSITAPKKYQDFTIDVSKVRSI